jgi:hypothetical protein
MKALMLPAHMPFGPVLLTHPATIAYQLCLPQVRMLKAIAQPADFVAFKLDIDNHQAGEVQNLKQQD